jgi:hypothetical protein
MIKYFDSYEVERLRKLIVHKETYLQTLQCDKSKAAYQLTQREIMFLKNDILPIVLNNTSVIHSEFVKYIIRCYDSALTNKCNGMLVYIPIDENYIDRPIIGIVNPRANQTFGSFGAMEIYVDNMDGNSAKVKPFNLILS